MSGASAAVERAPGERLASNTGFWLALHIFAWTVYATVSNAPGDIHHDMAEAYAWGREFQFGYFKHPPFWAWVTGLWFSLFPRADWAFYLLSMVNAAIGLWGAWTIAGRFIAEGPTRLAAALLLELTPFYHFLAFKYNANTALLPLWPWAIHFFLRVVEERDIRAGIWLGLIAGAGLLSKYYFMLLLAGFALAALFDARRWELARSAAPWIAIAVMLAAIAPHLWWLTQHDFGPFRYVSDSTHYSRGFVAWKALQFGVGCILFHVLVIAFLAVFSAGPRAALLRFADWGSSPPPRRLLLVATITPWAATMLIAILVNVRVDTNFAIAIFPAAPLILLTSPGYRLDRFGHFWLRRIVVLLIAVMLMAAPAISWVRFTRGTDGVDRPRSEAVAALQAIWDREFHAPLRIVAGAWPYADSAPFYAAGAVSQFIDFSLAKSPWITAERIAREGVAAICPEGDSVCIDRARQALGADVRERSFAARRRLFDREGPEMRFIVVMKPPAGSP